MQSMISPAVATAVRRPRRSVVVHAAGDCVSDQFAQTLAASLELLGIETIYLGRETSAQRIAATVAREGADALELCLAGGGVPLLRELLRELIRVGRRDVSIVLHRVESLVTESLP